MTDYSRIIPLAEAVVLELQNPISLADIGFTAFSQNYTIKRTYNTEQELEKGETLQLFVVPGKSPFELSSRGGLQSDIDIAIFVRKKMNVDEIEKVDDLVRFVEELNKYFVSLPDARLQYFDRAIYEASEVTPFLPVRLRSQREYMGILVVTFRVFEDDDE